MTIDEFPYVVKTSPKILSILQDYWDNKLRSSKIFLVLCGSSLSMMEKYVFGYKTPIYGRRTLDIKVPALTFNDALKFLLNLDLEGAIKTYAVLGGTPAYLLEFEKDLNNTIRKICSKQSFLLRETEFILREEVSKPRLFFSILHAASIGKTTSGEITNQTGLNKGVVGKYLSVLIDLDLISRDLPIDTSWKSRKGIYSIKDNFFNFWFRFIYPNLEYIETNPDAIIHLIKEDIDSYLGRPFEKMCKQFLIKEGITYSMKVGSWWYKEDEIDIVALNEKKKQLMFFECKHKNLRYNQSLKILEDLQEKAKLVRLFNDNRREQYGLIAKKIERKDKLRENGFMAFDLEDWK